MESVPVQNQAAAQKLLQKLSHPNQNDGPRRGRGRKYRGKEKQEDEVVFTLEEYENRKSQAKQHPVKDEVPDISHDENLAWQLQNQFNLEDSQVRILLSSTFLDFLLMLVILCFLYSFLLFLDTSQYPFCNLFQVQSGSHEANAEDIRMSMFNYERDDGGHEMAYGGRGRGRGRGRGHGRGRDRGRGRGRGRFS